MAGSIGIKVAIRCRPWTCESTLGLFMEQTDEESGQIELKNSTYTNNRFAFTWCWWTGHGASRYCKEDDAHNERFCDQMKMIGQTDVYESCGRKIKQDLLDGNAVVMFAYGLSGSGKTFTVFGPDAVDSPDAWFKHTEPQDLWGIFPRLGYEICNEKQDGWVLRMKYFQNVVDTVRDLMSATAAEQSYKAGMRKDQDGFMDIEWCKSAVIPSWDGLRHTFMDANARKAIAPTQFNHQSTRGHCIMTLELEKPLEDNPEMKQIGRLYVCDLAGTEPAGDIVYAVYKKETYEENGKTQIDYMYQGPHHDNSKTKELQDQGKKINLSLSEMAQFFMKMAEGIKKKTLKPGKSIPGCNSYFLCKYLKDTMLQAKTYLFCAVRPESKYLQYTYATLGFAKNASVIKLEPKKSTAGMSPNEIKMMKELEELKKIIEGYKKGEGLPVGDSGAPAAPGQSSEEVEKLKQMLEAKQTELANALEAPDDSSTKKAAEEAERQREEYGKRGVSLTVFDKETEFPYFVNLDQDPYRSNRFMYIINKPQATFGAGGDFQPMTLGVVANHCTVSKEGEKPDQTVSIIGGDGRTLVNGAVIKKGQKVQLKWFDRLVLGTEVLLFRHPGVEDPEHDEMPTAEMAFDEFAAAMNAETGVDDEALAKAAKEADEKHAEEMKKMEEEKANQLAAMEEEFQRKMAAMQADLEKKEAEKAAMANSSKEKEVAALEAAEAKKAAEEAAAKLRDEMEAQKKKAEEEFQEEKMKKQAARLNTAAVEADIRELIPKIKDLEMICAYLDRGFLTFEVTLQGKPELQVKVKVTNNLTDDQITLEKFAFASAYSVLKDEVATLQQAVLNERDYEFDEANDPVRLLFDNTVDLGTATSFLMGLAYNIGTDDKEEPHEIKKLVPPFDNIGMLQVRWTPIKSPENEDPTVEDVDDPTEFIGKPWTGKLTIEGAVDLPVKADLAYVSYTFNGQNFVTETVATKSRSPKFNYNFIHHVPNCDSNFVNYLENGAVNFVVHINPVIQESGKANIAVKDATINKNMRAMAENQKATAGGTYASVSITTSGPLPPLSDSEAEQRYKQKISELEAKLTASEDACKALQNRVKQLEAEVGGGSSGNSSVRLEDEAKSIFNMMDTDKNGALTPSELSYQLSDLGFPENEIEALFLRMDLNGDGKIELEEFVKNFKFYQTHLANHCK